MHYKFVQLASLLAETLCCFLWGSARCLRLVRACVCVWLCTYFVCLLACAPDNQKVKKCDIFYMKRRCLSGAWFCLFFYRLLFLIDNAPSHSLNAHTHTVALTRANALKQMCSDYVSRRLSLRRSQQKITHTHIYIYTLQARRANNYDSSTLPWSPMFALCVCAWGLYMHVCVYAVSLAVHAVFT